MKLNRYLKCRRESQKAFARRSGVPQQTINRLCLRGGASALNALKIVKATKGRVRLEDLCGVGEAKAKAS